LKVELVQHPKQSGSLRPSTSFLILALDIEAATGIALVQNPVATHSVAFRSIACISQRVAAIKHMWHKYVKHCFPQDFQDLFCVVKDRKLTRFGHHVLDGINMHVQLVEPSLVVLQLQAFIKQCVVNKNQSRFLKTQLLGNYARKEGIGKWVPPQILGHQGSLVGHLTGQLQLEYERAINIIPYLPKECVNKRKALGAYRVHVSKSFRAKMHLIKFLPNMAPNFCVVCGQACSMAGGAFTKLCAKAMTASYQSEFHRLLRLQTELLALLE
jgi:hypothetical protein